MAKKAASASGKKAPAQSEFSQPKTRRPFTVFLIVDDRDTRAAMVEELKQQKIEVRDYMTGMEFYRDYRESLPGVIVAEIRLRDMSGLELQNKLTAGKIEIPVVFIAGPADAPAAIEAMQNGALDFLLKPIAEGRMLDAVARAYASLYDVDWDYVGDDLDEIERSLGRLTGREREILDLIIGGTSSRHIGAQLGISTKTVEAHRARINDKMRADDLSHLVRMMYALNEE